MRPPKSRRSRRRRAKQRVTSIPAVTMSNPIVVPATNRMVKRVVQYRQLPIRRPRVIQRNTTSPTMCRTDIGTLVKQQTLREQDVSGYDNSDLFEVRINYEDRIICIKSDDPYI